MDERDAPEELIWEVEFVELALIAGALKRAELASWALRKVEQMEEPPLSIIELVDVSYKEFASSRARQKLSNAFGPAIRTRNLKSPYGMSALEALVGLQLKRGIRRGYTAGLGKRRCLEMLKKKPEIVDRFREIFPDVDLGEIA